MSDICGVNSDKLHAKSLGKDMMPNQSPLYARLLAESNMTCSISDETSFYIAVRVRLFRLRTFYLTLHYHYSCLHWGPTASLLTHW